MGVATAAEREAAVASAAMEMLEVVMEAVWAAAAWATVRVAEARLAAVWPVAKGRCPVAPRVAAALWAVETAAAMSTVVAGSHRWRWSTSHQDAQAATLH